MRACESGVKTANFLQVHSAHGKDTRNGMRMLATAVLHRRSRKKSGSRRAAFAGSGTAAAQRGSSDAPIRNSSTARAHWRPSRIAHTTSDWPRRMSPAVNTFGTEVW